MKDKKSRGQPKKDPSKRLEKVVQVKFREESYERLKAAAEDEGFAAVSTFVRALALRTIKTS